MSISVGLVGAYWRRGDNIASNITAWKITGKVTVHPP